jgi:uncharacterized OsmC-like protein
MVSDPLRRIGKLTVTVHMPKGLPEDRRKILEDAAVNCPVVKTLNAGVQIPTKFLY